MAGVSGVTIQMKVRACRSDTQMLCASFIRDVNSHAFDVHRVLRAHHVGVSETQRVELSTLGPAGSCEAKSDLMVGLLLSLPDLAGFWVPRAHVNCLCAAELTLPPFPLSLSAPVPAPQRDQLQRPIPGRVQADPVHRYREHSCPPCRFANEF